MTFDTFHAVFFTVAFIVPGFIWSSVLSMLVPRKIGAPEHRAHELLTLSSINYAIWSAPLFVFYRRGFPQDYPYWSGLVVFLVVFASPLGLALLTGWLQQWNAVAKFLGRLGFRTIHPIPTAWDYHFSQGQACWAVVSMRDGSRLYGFFGLRSFAGDDPGCRDLYLEAVFEPRDNGTWKPLDRDAGVWIAADHIALIEFRTVTELDHEEQEDEQANAPPGAPR